MKLVKVTGMSDHVLFERKMGIPLISHTAVGDLVVRDGNHITNFEGLEQQRLVVFTAVRGQWFIAEVTDVPEEAPK